MQFAQLRDTVDTEGNLVAKFSADVLQLDAGVFDGVVEKSGLQANQVHLHVGKNVRNVQGMDQVRLTRFADLAFMRLGRQTVRLFKRTKVLVRAQGVDLLRQLRIQLIDLAGRSGHFGGRHYTFRLSGPRSSARERMSLIDLLDVPHSPVCLPYPSS